MNVQAWSGIPVMINHASPPFLEMNTNLKVTKHIRFKRILLDQFPISIVVFCLGLNFKMPKQTIYSLKLERSQWIKRAQTLDKECQRRKLLKQISEKNKPLANTCMVLAIHFVSCLLCHKWHLDGGLSLKYGLLSKHTRTVFILPRGSLPLSSCAASALWKMILPKDNSSSEAKTGRHTQDTW